MLLSIQKIRQQFVQLGEKKRKDREIWDLINDVKRDKEKKKILHKLL